MSLSIHSSNSKTNSLHSFLSAIPFEEVLVKVDIKDIENFSLVCKLFKEKTQQNNFLWKEVAKKYGITPEKDSNPRLQLKQYMLEKKREIRNHFKNSIPPYIQNILKCSKAPSVEDNKYLDTFLTCGETLTRWQATAEKIGKAISLKKLHEIQTHQEMLALKSSYSEWCRINQKEISSLLPLGYKVDSQLYSIEKNTLSKRKQPSMNRFTIQGGTLLSPSTEQINPSNSPTKRQRLFCFERL